MGESERGVVMCMRARLPSLSLPFFVTGMKGRPGRAGRLPPNLQLRLVWGMSAECTMDGWMELPGGVFPLGCALGLGRVAVMYNNVGI